MEDTEREGGSRGERGSRERRVKFKTNLLCSRFVAGVGVAEGLAGGHGST